MALGSRISSVAEIISYSKRNYKDFTGVKKKLILRLRTNDNAAYVTDADVTGRGCEMR
jgi:hypothetical protein